MSEILRYAQDDMAKGERWKSDCLLGPYVEILRYARDDMAKGERWESDCLLGPCVDILRPLGRLRMTPSLLWGERTWLCLGLWVHFGRTSRKDNAATQTARRIAGGSRRRRMTVVIARKREIQWI